MVSERDVPTQDGRILHVYDTAPDVRPEQHRLTVFWQHGTPNLGSPPGPLLAWSAARGVRWIGHDRPAYGGSTPVPGRDVASAAADVAAIADAAGIDRFAVMGHSGGGPHALACAALLPDRVLAAVPISTLAPSGASGLDWFAGMASAGAAELGAALAGREQLAALLSSTDFDPEQFTPADRAALAGDWAWFEDVVGPALAAGPDGMLDDDLAYVAPWGFDPALVRIPVLLLHGRLDRIAPHAHAEWLAHRIPGAQLWTGSEDGHLSVLRSARSALEWLLEHADGAHVAERRPTTG